MILTIVAYAFFTFLSSPSSFLSPSYTSSTISSSAASILLTSYTISGPKACFVPASRILRTIAVPHLPKFSGACFLSGCIPFYRLSCKRSCFYHPWSSQRVTRYRCWGMGQAIFAMWWMRYVCVGLHRFRGWLFLRSLIRGSQIWERFVDAYAPFWWASDTRNWPIACRLTSCIQVLVFRRMLRLLGALLQLWASFSSSCKGNICWLA